VAEDVSHRLAEQCGKQVSTHLWGQEINAETYAICKTDLLLKGEDGGRGETETDRLSAIIEEFNDLFGGNRVGDPGRVVRRAAEDLPAAVAKDAKFRNARRNSDRENARVESDKATVRATLDMMQDDTRFFQCFSDDSDFRRWVMRTVFREACEATG